MTDDKERLRRAEDLAKRQDGLVINPTPKPEGIQLPEGCKLSDEDAEKMGLEPPKSIMESGMAMPKGFSLKDLPKEGIRGPKYPIAFPRFSIPKMRMRVAGQEKIAWNCPVCKLYVFEEDMEWENREQEIPLMCKTCQEQGRENPPQQEERYRMGFFAYEEVGMADTNVRELADKLRDDDDCQRYFSHQGKPYLQPGRGSGYHTVPILEHLKGMVLCNAVLAWVHGYNPSYIRITEGECTTDAIPDRVTIFVKRKKKEIDVVPGRAVSKSTSTAKRPTEKREITVLVVERIEQEQSCGYGCGYDVDVISEAIFNGKKLPDTISRGPFGHTKGLERADFT